MQGAVDVGDGGVEAEEQATARALTQRAQREQMFRNVKLTPCHASGTKLEGGEDVFGVGADAVVGVGFGEEDLAGVGDDEGGGEGETPGGWALFAVDEGDVDEDGAVVLLHGLGHGVGDAELRGEGAAGVGEERGR